VIINIPFKAQFRDSMIMMKKTCTSRTRQYGHYGDIFEAFSCQFKITQVDVMILRDIASLLFRQEGCTSPEQFEKVWARIHPRKGFVWNQAVYVHHFEKIA